MPLYSQNEPDYGSTWLPNGPSRSMLCGPTSAAMCLAANLQAAPPSGATPWLDAFRSGGRVERVTRMAEWLGTDPSDGTDRTESISGFVSLRAQMTYGGVSPEVFSVAPTHDASATTPGSLVREMLRTTPGILVHFGRYRERRLEFDYSFLKLVIVEYERDGGHLVALRGHEGDVFELHDPTQADHRWDTLVERRGSHEVTLVDGVVHQSMEFLPNDSPARHYFPTCEKNGDLPFIDLIGGIRNAR
jgi:hypothetical protein